MKVYDTFLAENQALQQQYEAQEKELAKNDTPPEEQSQHLETMLSLSRQMKADNLSHKQASQQFSGNNENDLQSLAQKSSQYESIDHMLFTRITALESASQSAKLRAQQIARLWTLNASLPPA